MSRRITGGPDLTAREAAYLHKYKPQSFDDVEAAQALDDAELVLAAATAAYVTAAEELLAQLRDQELDPDLIYVTIGAGMTLAGLVLWTLPMWSPELLHAL